MKAAIVVVAEGMEDGAACAPDGCAPEDGRLETSSAGAREPDDGALLQLQLPPEEDPRVWEAVLKLLTHADLPVTWANLGPLLRVSHVYDIAAVRSACALSSSSGSSSTGSSSSSSGRSSGSSSGSSSSSSSGSSSSGAGGPEPPPYLQPHVARIPAALAAALAQLLYTSSNSGYSYGGARQVVAQLTELTRHPQYKAIVTDGGAAGPHSGLSAGWLLECGGTVELNGRRAMLCACMV
ncbi:hypothetical protein HYH02_008054 [Chlamydomonas schloesseri]|uniref:Uncharacterized protein n=1 Tax=Chlamydomonas schloesseri TaxID=2026947 RepID=A0A835WGH5_9CHLO|nr:hypothetical protein HYH02_008054 [Chlamydomonas schloesseri]|eukprot:KAG2446898.1 hypothetical protein HYH02_008054 [Chlamydomonas schloesseri]